MEDKFRADVQETLLILYLRLNGYFTSGFIVHSPDLGKNTTQIDALGVRHPFNREPRREIKPSPFLGLKPDHADLLLCEVKSRGEQLQFNESFRENESAVKEVLGWAGLFDESETDKLAKELKPLLQPCTPAQKAKEGISGPRNVGVRPLLCSPERMSSRTNQPWSLTGEEIFSFISQCLNPKDTRNQCSVRYDLHLWGPSLSRVVSYFKTHADVNIDELYGFLCSSAVNARSEAQS